MSSSRLSERRINPELASDLPIEERELETGGVNQLAILVGCAEA